MTIADNNAWTNYWAKGFLSTFVDADQENYSGQIKEYWDNAFSELPANSTICDLGAGNGAILALAKQYMAANNITFELIAVDYSDVSGSEFYREHPDIRVHANTLIERLDIEAHSVDLCVSQFGFEYSNTDAAVKQVQRILDKGGRFKALMHHQGSEVALGATSAIQQITLCDRSELTEVTLKLLKRLHKLSKSHRSPTQDKKAEDLRNYFNQMATRLNSYADNLPDADHVTYFLNELGNLFSNKSNTTNENIAVVEKLIIDSREYRQRMESMLQASSDDAKIHTLVDKFADHGLACESPAEFSLDGNKFAWIFEAIKT